MQAKELKEEHIFGCRMEELPITAANNPFLITHTDHTSSWTEHKAAASAHKQSHFTTQNSVATNRGQRHLLTPVYANRELD